MRHTPVLEYALIAVVAIGLVAVLVTALAPVMETMIDGFHILSQLFAGTFVPGKP